MATADYIISNQSGASFRTDLNNTLAAIVSNNSNSSSPATTYAYQWWADTSAGTLKIRNAANNAWIELFQLDGTLTLEDGTASTPALAFRDDLNTGIFSSAADTFDISTGGVSRVQIDSSEITFNESGANTDFRVESDNETHMFFIDAGNDRVGIGTSSPRRHFHIHESASSTVGMMLTNGATGQSNDSQGFQIKVGNDGTANIDQRENAALKFFINATDAMMLDTSRRLLVGATSSTATGVGNSKLQISGTGADTAGMALIRTTNDAGGAYLQFVKNRGGAIQEDDNCGAIAWLGHDGTDNNNYLAQISVHADANAGSNAMSGRIEFGTTDNSTVFSERMSIDSKGAVLIGRNADSYTSTARARLSIDCESIDAVAALGDASRYGLVFLNSPSSNEGNGIGFFNDSGSTCGGAILHVDKGGGNIGQLQFFTSASSDTPLLRAKITESGQFLIGTSANNSANHKLIVSGDGTPSYFANGAGLLVQVTNSNDNHCAEFFQGRYNRRCITHSHSNTGSVTFDVFEQNDSNVGSITSDGSNCSYNGSSDYRLKENIVNLTDGITRIKQLIPRRFNWIADSTNTLIDGFIAHEVSPVLPQAVVGEKDAVEEDGSIDPQQMDYSKLTPLLTAALQEAIAKIETLETKVAALEAA